MSTQTRADRPAADDEARTGSAVVATPHLRLTARGRAVVATLALAAAGVAGVAGVGTRSAEAGSGLSALPVVGHTVTPGETLWDLARSVAEPGQDVRDVVRHLQGINGMSGSHLQAGQQVLVPTR